MVRLRSQSPLIRCLLLLALAVAALSPIGTPVRANAPSTAFVLQPPEVTAKAVFAIDVTAGVELYALNADKRRPPASTTKIATALVVVRAVKDLSEAVTIETSDIADISPDESQMGLIPGDMLTIEQLLYGLMIQSGNDAAAVLARVVGAKLLGDDGEGDPRERFVEEMNNLAAELKLENTHFTNPSGLYHREHYSTARDLAALAAAALQNETIATIVKQRQETITSLASPPNVYDLRTTNRLLGEKGIHGVKTGSLPEAGACLVVAKTMHGKNRVIVVVLGSDYEYDESGFIDPEADRRWDDTRTILDALERDFRWISPSDPEDLPELQDELAAWQVTLKDQSALVIPADQATSFRYRLTLGPEAAPQEPVGSLHFFLGETQLAERPVFQLPTG